MNTKEKAEFLRRWLEVNSSATVQQARQAVVDKFGEGLGTGSLNAVIKEWRQGASTPQSKPLPPARDYSPTPIQLVTIPRRESVHKKLVRELTTIAELAEGERLEYKAVAAVCGPAMVAVGIKSLTIEQGTVLVTLENDFRPSRS